MKSSGYAGGPPPVPVQGVVVYPVQQQSVPVAPVVQQVQGQVVYPQGQPMMAYSQQQPVVYQASVMRQPLGPAAASAPSAPLPPYQQPMQPTAMQQQPMFVQQPMMVQQQPMAVQPGEQPQLLTLGTTESSKQKNPTQLSQCQRLVGINDRMRKADIAAVSLAAVVFIMTIVIVFVPAWGQFFRKEKVSGGGVGTTQCYLETTLNIGLFQRDQLVYYHCELAGNVLDEVRENQVGMTMDCAYIRDSSTADDSDIDAACDDLSSAQVAGTITFLCATFQLFRIWLRFCSFRNVSVWSLSIVPLVCVVQLICAFVSVGAYTTVNDVIDVGVFQLDGTQLVQDVTMRGGGSWGTMITVGVLTIFQLSAALVTFALWRQNPLPPNKGPDGQVTDPCNSCCVAAGCCAIGVGCAGCGDQCNDARCSGGCSGGGGAGLCELLCCIISALK